MKRVLTLMISAGLPGQNSGLVLGFLIHEFAGHASTLKLLPAVAILVPSLRDPMDLTHLLDSAGFY